ncbi:hypothetical protein D9757_011352 [Collybiopsis confluens]|uniref:Uncharacterized protein n=1 Tax=Collybiopsis confluens TaxID=2823264 RepID=A0A8H5GAK7_9AGAR|nr:hypothetical protein D9757_011352 [Collybiopsis confluens]
MIRSARSTKSKAPKPEPPQLTAAELDLLMRQFIGGGSVERNVKRAKKEEKEKERQEQLDLPHRDERRRRRRFGSLDTKSNTATTTPGTTNKTNIILPTLSANTHPYTYPVPESQSHPPAYPYPGYSSSQNPAPGLEISPTDSWFSNSYYDIREFAGTPEQGWVTYDPFAASTSVSASSSPVSITSTLPLPPYYPSPPTSPSISISPYDMYIPPIPVSANAYPGKRHSEAHNSLTLMSTPVKTKTTTKEKEKASTNGFSRFRGRAKSLFGFGGH